VTPVAFGRDALPLTVWTGRAMQYVVRAGALSACLRLSLCGGRGTGVTVRAAASAATGGPGPTVRRRCSPEAALDMRLALETILALDGAATTESTLESAVSGAHAARFSRWSTTGKQELAANEEGEASSTPVLYEVDVLDRKVASDDFDLQMLLALDDAPSQLRTDDPACPLHNARHGWMIFDALGPLLREAGFNFSPSEPADRVLLHKLLFTWKDGSAACKQLFTYATIIAYARLHFSRPMYQYLARTAESMKRATYQLKRNIDEVLTAQWRSGR
jgi:hypothetical protein